ncbi:hypothetical protein HK102_012516, partial [Quaeritorhiza haematococci]
MPDANTSLTKKSSGGPPPAPKGPKQPPPANWNEWFGEFVIDYRFLWVVPLLLPMSTAFNVYWAVREYFVRTWGKQFRTHEGNVKYIQDQIKRWKENGSKGLLCTARPSWLA